MAAVVSALSDRSHPEGILARQARRESSARTYPRNLPLALGRGEGIHVTSSDGRTFIDCLAGAGTLALGHNHPVVVEAVRAALDRGLPLQTLDLATPVSDELVTELLAELPPELARGARIQFCGPSGADAVEAAWKLTKTATGRRGLLAFHGGYHGMTHGALAATGTVAAKAPVGGLAGEVQFLPFPSRYRCPLGIGVVPGVLVLSKALGGGLPLPAAADRHRGAGRRHRRAVRRRGRGRGTGSATGRGPVTVEPALALEALLGDATPAARAARRAVLEAAAACLDQVASERQGPYSGASPEDLAELVAGIDPLPAEGAGVEAALRTVGTLALRHAVDPAHPATAAHLHCAPLHVALAGELLAAAANPSLDSWDQAPVATHLEQRLVRAIAGMAGYDPAVADGVLTSGGTQSNLQGLLLARERAGRRGGRDLAADGLGDGGSQPLSGYRLDWLTRSAGFFPMEYSKLGLEHFTPDYTRYFQSLPQPTRDRLVPTQDLLYKGIDAETVATVYDLLYERTVGGQAPPVRLLAHTEVRAIEPDGDRWRLRCHQWEQGAAFSLAADRVVLATGYRSDPPACIGELRGRIRWDAAGRYRVGPDYRVETDKGVTGSLFVQNAELHTHGVGAPDLGLGAHRAATIVNALAGRQVYRLPARSAFTDFAAPTDQGAFQ